MKNNWLSSLSEETNRQMEEMRKPLQKKGDSSDTLRRDYLAEDFYEQAANIYEAIIIMSKRARQLGQRQTRIIEQFIASKMRPDDDENEDEYVRPFDDDDEDAPRLPKFEKPTILAMNEMHQGKIKYKYKE
jgi:DNA-directed RNA polymerase subunit K/omega